VNAAVEYVRSFAATSTARKPRAAARPKPKR
jgi:hypothetical protein